MKICGIKLTHDGSVALIDNGKLIFSYEMEKVGNSARFSEIEDVNIIPVILAEYGYRMEDIDRFVVDGWQSFVTKNYNGQPVAFDLEQYGAVVVSQDLMTHSSFTNKFCSYNSYMHVSGHVFGAYCTSPFAKKQESSFVLVWDGGMCPQLFYYDYETNTTENLRPLFMLNGNIYTAFAQQYEPYKDTGRFDMSVAGKVMAYIAKGNVSEEMLEDFRKVYQSIPSTEADLTSALIGKLYKKGEDKGYRPVDMIATFHVFIEQLLTSALKERLKAFPDRYKRNICFTGGCALNIKWNSAIRSCGVFDEMWVPPFPNDSGSAVGAACCEMIAHTAVKVLDWSVYLGPGLVHNEYSGSWNKKNCSIGQLAELLHVEEEPVVFLNGRAELGPRALGNRSIIAKATNGLMKEKLNMIKNRENYRPVAPICILEDAPGIFTPGSPDPLMLYDHKVKEEWKEKIPAICHLDGTARLQTISREDNPDVYELLTEYKKLTGVPVLCNTSANYNGKGFFCDVASAISWGKVNYVWSNYILYYSKEKTTEVAKYIPGEAYNVINL
ncbi:MAG: hypothetical protein JWO44_2302 [Bacteroidetes bacterium]|nr:hypothetical protein [Bacteroidota bacterium]